MKGAIRVSACMLTLNMKFRPSIQIKCKMLICITCEVSRFLNDTRKGWICSGTSYIMGHSV